MTVAVVEAVILPDASHMAAIGFPLDFSSSILTESEFFSRVQRLLPACDALLHICMDTPPGLANIRPAKIF